MPGRVTLLTDFGTRDGYVGAVKGVIARAVPGVILDDVSHEIPPGDVWGASYALARYWRLYPAGTVHLAVVDPGVGTARRPLACEAEGRFLVAPDNGVLSRVLADSEWTMVQIVEVAPPPDVRSGVSATFHARDVFAPAAAHLAWGRSLLGLGSAVTNPIRLVEPRAVREGTGGSGLVVAIDRFGNLLTNLPGDWIAKAKGAHVEVAGEKVPVRSTYGEGAPNELMALVSSDGRVEIAVREGSAAARLKVGRGAAVRVVGQIEPS